MPSEHVAAALRRQVSIRARELYEQSSPQRRHLISYLAVDADTDTLVVNLDVNPTVVDLVLPVAITALAIDNMAMMARTCRSAVLKHLVSSYPLR
jgi:hypothetical protein